MNGSLDLPERRVVLDPVAAIVAAIQCSEAVGFRPVGTIRQDERQSDGRWADGLQIDVLAAVWGSGPFS